MLLHMHLVRLLPTVVRESLARHPLKRVPERDVAMERPEQVRAFTDAGRRGVMEAVYLHHAARVSQVIAGCERVLDLGCGPGTQLARVAQLNPRTSFVGVDLSSRMLAEAERHLRESNVPNVRVLEDDITRLSEVEDDSYDGVMSTMALHHLLTTDHLRLCFRQVGRVLRPGGAVCIVDFARLKRPRSIEFLARLDASRQPDEMILDTEQSMRAAFATRELQTASSDLLPRTRIYTTFGIQMFVMVKTQDQRLSPEVRSGLAAQRAALEPEDRRSLDHIRLFFRLGGLRDDPFSNS
jgi:SAM-dependent methyltransferase